MARAKPLEIVEVTPEYVAANWREAVDRARRGERLRVVGAGITIVPTELEDESVREWGGRELAQILAAGRGENDDLTDDELMELVDREVHAHRAERADRSADD
jgi:hypothetical protein